MTYNRELREEYDELSRPDAIEYIGELVNDVPTVEPERTCNARLHNNLYQFVGFCNEESNGRCRRHKNDPLWPAKDLRDGNQFAQKHGLHSDPMNYLSNIKDPSEKKEIDELKASLLDRMEQNGENDEVDEKMAKRLATRLHIVEQASEYLQRHGLTQTVIPDSGGSYEKKQPVLDEIRRYDQSIVSDMKSLGILDDPETKKADALESWREYIG